MTEDELYVKGEESGYRRVFGIVVILLIGGHRPAGLPDFVVPYPNYFPGIRVVPLQPHCGI